MKFLVILFSLIGIGLHVRMMEFLADPKFGPAFADGWNNAPVSNRVLVVGAIALPFAFYGFCLVTGTVAHRRWWLTLSGTVICVMVYPFFTKLYDVNPMVAKSAGSTALLAIPRYLCLPGRRSTITASRNEGDE